MEFENDVKAVVAEMAEALNKNYSDQKLFDLLAVVRGRGIAVQIVRGIDFQQYTVSCR